MAGKGRVSILGVTVCDLSQQDAVELLDSLITAGTGTHAVYIVNAHTLNLATDDPAYIDVLRSADYVFGDGSGVALAALVRGVRLKANLNGTDLMPAMLEGLSGRDYRYYLLGSSHDAVTRAGAMTQREFPGWHLAGCHAGHLDAERSREVCADINAAKPDVLLVGMGNPTQELWIREYRHLLDVPVCIGVGGLFDRWAGDHPRAPRWLRRLGLEWVHRMFVQPQTRRRYLVGNPKFVWRMLRALPGDRRALHAGP